MLVSRKPSLRTLAACCFSLFALCATSAGQSSSMISPSEGSSLTAGTVTFTWEDVDSQYLLYVGTSPLGVDLWFGSLTSATSAAVPNVPDDVPVYVRLWTRVSPGSSSYYVRSYSYNIDIDGDGIEDSIDPDPETAAAMRVFEGAEHTLRLLGSGRVAELQVSETLFDTMAVGGSTSALMRELSNMVFDHLEDAFDFIFFISDQDSAPAEAEYSGIHYLVQNDIEGIGWPITDGSSLYGSAGELESAVHLTTKKGLSSGASLHELGHRWANGLQSIPTAISGHWGYSSVGGQLGGWAEGTLRDNGDGTYSAHNGNGSWFGGHANGGNALGYSDFELYLMGLIPIDGLPDITVAEGFASVSSGTFTATGFTTVTMADVLATDGVRVPDHTQSQKAFRAIVVVLTKEPLEHGRWAGYDLDVHKFALDGSDGESHYNFWEATGGRATLEMGGLLEEVRGDGGLKHAITGLSFSGADTLVSFRTESGKSYRLERSGAVDGPWLPVHSGIAGDGTVKVLTDTGGGNLDARFYRLVEE